MRSSSSTDDYVELLARIRAEGLLERRRGFYLAVFAALVAALALLVTVMVRLGSSPYQLVVAGLLGLVMVQFGFLAHEAAHREVFASVGANAWAARLVGALVVGMSLHAWRVSHSRHHAQPNVPGRDPSLKSGVLTFTVTDATPTRGRLHAWFRRHQGHLVPVVLLLAGLSLYVDSFVGLLGRHRVEHRAVELGLVLVRHLAWPLVVFATMPVGLGAAFLGVQVAVFGLLSAGSFLPNHLGLPLQPAGRGVDFLQRQVRASRNIRGGALMTAWMGGLNFQIEHHLFPSMPRPYLRRASVLVRRHCAEHGIPYTQTSLRQAYRDVARYLDEVGVAAARVGYRCPVASALGR
jgi:fatty acid desaturase